MEMQVVVCHYKENLDWLSLLQHPYVVYNKNPHEQHLFVRNLPNYGFDTFTYLTYITDNYDCLPDYVCFAQDYPFDHCSNFIELVNEFDFQKKWFPLGLCYERSSTAPTHPPTCHLDQSLRFAESHGIICKLPLKFVHSAQCIVSKDLIRQRTVSFYENLKSVFPTDHPITDVNYILEYLWPTILGFADEIDTNCYDGCAQYMIQPGKRK